MSIKDEGGIETRCGTGLEYNDLIFVDSAAKTNTQKVFSEAALSSDEEPDFTLVYPLQYKKGKIEEAAENKENTTTFESSKYQTT